MKGYNFVTEVKSKSSDKYYTIKMRDDGLLTCNCPSWIYNQRGNRTCKHVDEIVGSGFTADEQGKFIVSTNRWGGKVPVFCKNYPKKCNTCRLRFICYTELSPEFSVEQLQDAGVTK